ncbi:rho-related GTP-binding protein RhoE-like isoform X2 [Centruroides sculpturatus]|uniref:rho-related GTP-binding protein RhoE-like isoform X2 n=1 Tax=Centruroides sculpturatus TaxID=218467 RepID=UPI000C6EE826|nr:rho-related GTP-binding protein RhoE-like isoform X2 [Centruroides sculpturatus]
MDEVNCKLVLVGDSQCGKTALIQRFITDNFTEVYSPTGFERYTASYEVSDYRINFTLWDTSGASAYDTVRPLSYQDAKVFLLCFHICHSNSLDNTVNKWCPEVRQHSPNVPIILCGCQSDLRTDRETLCDLGKGKKSPVTSEQALAVSRQIGATTYVETSSKSCSRSVRDAFEVAALAALGKLNKNHVTRPYLKVNCMSKIDLKDELREKARHCVVM